MTSPQRLVWDATARTRGWFALASATAVLGSAGTLAFPWAMARALDAVVARRPATGPVLVCAALLALVVTTGALQTLANGGYGSGTVAVLRRSLARRALDAGVPGTAEFAAGDLAGRLSAGCAQAGSAGVTLVTASAAVLTSLGGVVALWLLDWRIGLCFSLGVPPLVLIARGFMNRGSGLFLRYQEAQGRISALLLEALGGADHRRERHGGGRDAPGPGTPAGAVPHRAPGLGAPAGHRMAGGAADPGRGGAGALRRGLALLHGDISAGELAAVVAYTALAMAALDQLDALFALGMSAAGARRVAEVVDQPVPAPGTRDRPAAGPGTVTLSGVTVRSGTRLVLDAVDLVVPAGTALAVVGRSGAGKSTPGGVGRAVAGARRGPGRHRRRAAAGADSPGPSRRRRLRLRAARAAGDDGGRDDRFRPPGRLAPGGGGGGRGRSGGRLHRPPAARLRHASQGRAPVRRRGPTPRTGTRVGPRSGGGRPGRRAVEPGHRHGGTGRLRAGLGLVGPYARADRPPGVDTRRGPIWWPGWRTAGSAPWARTRICGNAGTTGPSSRRTPDRKVFQVFPGTARIRTPGSRHEREHPAPRRPAPVRRVPAAAPRCGGRGGGMVAAGGRSGTRLRAPRGRRPGPGLPGGPPGRRLPLDRPARGRDGLPRPDDPDPDPLAGTARGAAAGRTGDSRGRRGRPSRGGGSAETRRARAWPG